MNSIFKNTAKALCASIGLFAIVGCAQVSPWERGDLARKEMGFGLDKTDSAIHQHVYFSKEAASGGYSTGGGGCGCN